MSEKKEFEKLSSKELKEKYEKPIDRIKHMSNGQIVIRTFLLFAIIYKYAFVFIETASL